MAKAYKCDLCGKYFSLNGMIDHNVTVPDKTEYTFGRLSFAHNRVIDVCVDCLSQISDTVLKLRTANIILEPPK